MMTQETVYRAKNGCTVESVGRGYIVHNAQRQYIGEAWTIQQAKKRADRG